MFRRLVLALILGTLTFSGCATPLNVNLATIIDDANSSRIHRIDEDLTVLQRNFWAWYGYGVGDPYKPLLLPRLSKVDYIFGTRYVLSVGGVDPSPDDPHLVVQLVDGEITYESHRMGDILVSSQLLINVQCTPERPASRLTIRVEPPKGEAIEQSFLGAEFFEGSYFGVVPSSAD